MNLNLLSLQERFKSAAVSCNCTLKIEKFLSILAVVFFSTAVLAQNSSSLTVGGFLNKSEIRKFSESEEGRSARILENPPPSTHVGLIKVRPTALSSAEVEIELPDGKREAFITTTYPVSKDERSGTRRWEGRWKSEIVDGRPRQLASITLVSQYDEKKRITTEHVGGGNLTAHGMDYEIVGLSGDYVAFIKRDNSQPRRQHPENWKEFQEKKRNLEKKSPPEDRVDGAGGLSTAAVNSSPVLRVLFAISPDATSLRNWSIAIPQLVGSINQIYQRSQSNLRIESAGISYRVANFSDMFAAQDRGLTLGLMVDRDNANADIVVLLGQYATNACGLAQVAPQDAKNAIAVIKANCGELEKVIAHEIGHILGGRHLVNQDANNQPYPWGHGFWVRTPSIIYSGKYYCAGTIMMGEANPNSPNCITQGGGVDNAGNGWTDFFSTTANYYGDGTPVGNASYANMVRVTNEAGPVYAQYRNEKLSKRLLPAIMLMILQLLE